MRKINSKERRNQFIKGVSRYLLSQKCCSMSFYEGLFPEDPSDIRCFQKMVFIMTYIGIQILKLKKEATTTLKNSEPELYDNFAILFLNK